MLIIPYMVSLTRRSAVTLGDTEAWPGEQTQVYLQSVIASNKMKALRRKCSLEGLLVTLSVFSVILNVLLKREKHRFPDQYEKNHT